jgi:hypothetical protein
MSIGHDRGERIIPGPESKTRERPPNNPCIGIENPSLCSPPFSMVPKIFSSKGGQKFLLENSSQKFPTLDLKQNF